MNTSTKSKTPIGRGAGEKRPDPLRSPAWRWEKAEEWVEERRRPPKGTDPYVRAAFHMLGGTRFRPKHVDGELLEAVGTARRVRDRQRMAHLLECLVLTGDEPEKIGSVMGLSPAVIVAYERMYYDVRPSLAARGFVMCHLLDEEERVSREQVAEKRLAYAQGSEVLLEYVETGALSDGTRNLLQRFTEDQTVRKSFVAALAPIEDNRDAARWFDRSLKLQRLELRQKEAELKEELQRRRLESAERNQQQRHEQADRAMRLREEHAALREREADLRRRETDLRNGLKRMKELEARLLAIDQAIQQQLERERAERHNAARNPLSALKQPARRRGAEVPSVRLDRSTDPGDGEALQHAG